MTAELPDFIPPMLAQSAGEPFDSDEHVFEVKWDGFRAVAYVDAAGYRLMTRRRNDLAPRYPELDFLAGLPPGLVLDGEIVLLRDGKPDFYGLLEREQARGELRIRAAATGAPTTYVAFDLLVQDHRPLMGWTLERRRAALAALVAAHPHPRWAFSDGVVGHGVQFFEEAQRRDLEGIMAKRLASTYTPGRRTNNWIKIKRVHELQCAVLGWVPDEQGDLRSLIIAAQREAGGELACVGRVGSGMTDDMRTRLRKLVAERGRDEPWLECDIPGNWIEPGLYCSVSYLEFTKTGTLRAPVLRELTVDPE